MQMQLERTEQELQVRNYSPKTVKSYLYGLREYFGFKKINEVTALRVRDMDLEEMTIKY